jgi:hypothetical protein
MLVGANTRVANGVGRVEVHVVKGSHLWTTIPAWMHDPAGSIRRCR